MASSSSRRPAWRRWPSLPSRSSRPMSQPSPLLRMAVIGCGRIGTLHAQAIAACRDAELTAVYDLQEVRALALSEQLGASVYTDLQSLLKEAAPQAVTVATPDD